MEGRLCAAIRGEDTGDALTLLDDPNALAWINNPTATGTTCLYLACECGNLAIIQGMLAIPGIDVNKGGRLGTPLHVVTRHRNTDVIELLLSHGAECKEDHFKATPLHTAAEIGAADALNCLLKVFSQNVNDRSSNVSLITSSPKKSPNGSSPLHLAAFHGHLGCTEVLVKHRADIRLTAGGRTPYELALQNNHGIVADYLKHIASNISIANSERISACSVPCGETKADNQMQKQDYHRQSQCDQLVTECLHLNIEDDDPKQRFSKSSDDQTKGILMAECVKKNFTYLLENLDISDHLDYLFQEDALSLEDYQVIFSKAGDIAKTRETLIRLLGKKNCDWTKVFYKSLEIKAKDLLVIFK